MISTYMGSYIMKKLTSMLSVLAMASLFAGPAWSDKGAADELMAAMKAFLAREGAHD